MIRQKGFCNKCEYSNKLEEVKRHLEKNEMKRRNKREHEEKGGIFGLGYVRIGRPCNLLIPPKTADLSSRNKTWTDEEIEEEKHAREAYEQAQERICQIKAVRTQMDQDYLEAELKADEELVNRVREQYDKFMESLRQVRAVRARRDQDNLDATPKAQENS